MRIDSHQHFWLFDPAKDTWITDEKKVIQRSFLPNDISKTLKDNCLDGAVLVQARQSFQETEFLVELAEAYKMVKAVIGWIDLGAEDIDLQLSKLSSVPIVKGFRHPIEKELDADFLIRPDIQRGIIALTKYNYTFDLLIHSRHYASTLECVAANPNQAFMLNHMAIPVDGEVRFYEWSNFIKALSLFPNVYCKVSRLMTRMIAGNRSVDALLPYFNHVASCFGTKRLCFGSDWPVSLLAASYDEVLHLAEVCLEGRNDVERADFWGNNAVRFYNIT